jgi:hypothetical protein
LQDEQLRISSWAEKPTGGLKLVGSLHEPEKKKRDRYSGSQGGMNEPALGLGSLLDLPLYQSESLLSSEIRFFSCNEG